MLKHCILAIALCGTPVLALAQDSWASSDYDYASRQLNDFTSRFERDLVDPVQRGVRKAKADADAGAAKPGGSRTAAAGNTTVPVRSPRLPQQMAAAYPSDKRELVQRTFEDLLSGYQRVEQQFGIAPYDVASGVAAFLAGCYMGFHNAGFPDQHFKPLVAQMRQILSDDAGWAQTSVADKQDMYEQLAILGMLMANTQMALKKQPDARAQAAMQAAARGYLEQFLKVDAAKVQLSAKGLSLR